MVNDVLRVMFKFALLSGIQLISQFARSYLPFPICETKSNLYQD